jgi:hypothetical protein
LREGRKNLYLLREGRKNLYLLREVRKNLYLMQEERKNLNMLLGGSCTSCGKNLLPVEGGKKEPVTC